MINLVKRINRMSDVMINSTFGVGSQPICDKNAKKSMSPEQAKRLMIKTREYRFITDGQLLLRKSCFEKNILEKLKLKAMKSNSKFEGKLLLTNKF